MELSVYRFEQLTKPLINPVLADLLKDARFCSTDNMTVIQRSPLSPAEMNYHYIVMSGGSNYRAFEKREQFVKWLELHGLTLTEPLADPSSLEFNKIQFVGINGVVNEAAILVSNYETQEGAAQEGIARVAQEGITRFEQLYNDPKNTKARYCSNADYVRSVIVKDDDGTLIHVFPRSVYYGKPYALCDHHESRMIFG